MTYQPIYSVTHSRSVEQILNGQAVTEGAGVKITRLLGTAQQRRLDPFLMLDAFSSDDPEDYLAGFLPHPHRGFEAITYMLVGNMRHRDSTGHEGLLQSGGVQWMNAGRGIIHSEMPEQQAGVMAGFQLWLNLPAQDKLSPPNYRDIAANQIPQYTTQGLKVKVIAGQSHGVSAVVNRPVTEPLYLDIQLAAGQTFQQQLPLDHNALIYLYQGEVSIQQLTVSQRQLAILSNHDTTDGVIITAQQAAKLLLIAGKPLGEPIVQHGPFVMNSHQEIEQALSDYRDGLFE